MSQNQAYRRSASDERISTVDDGTQAAHPATYPMYTDTMQALNAIDRLPARLAAALLRQPRWIVRWLARRHPDVLFEADTDERIVALTIDDGPHAETTPYILDVLDRHRARATFFLLCDNVPGNEPVVRALVAGGHEIGNHLLSDTPSIALPIQQFAEALDQSHAILGAFGAVRWFRPSSGWFNRRMLGMLAERGYRCVLGSVYPYDPLVSSRRVIEEHILSSVHPGAIIVLHDGPDRGRTTADALAHIIPVLVQRGYRVVTVSDLIRRSLEVRHAAPVA